MIFLKKCRTKTFIFTIGIIKAFPEAPEIINGSEALRAPESLESSVAHGTRDPLGKNKYILLS